MRASLDHLKVLGEEEFGVPAKEVEEEGDAAVWKPSRIVRRALSFGSLKREMRPTLRLCARQMS